MSCIYVFSIPLFICDFQVPCQFYSGTIFLYICVNVTVLFIEEEEEEEEEKEEEDQGRRVLVSKMA